MKRFHFPFTALLMLRRSQRDQCQKYLQEALQKDDEFVARIAEVESARTQTQAEFRELTQKGIVDVDGSAQRNRYALELRGELRAIADVRARLAEHIALCRRAVTKAEQAVKSLEKLEDNQRQEFQKQELHREALEVEEAWSAVHLSEGNAR